MSTVLGHLIATADGHRLELARDLPASVDRVWRLLTEPDERAAWLMPGVLEPRVGGVVDLADDHHHVTGRVVTCEPPRLLVLTWSSADAPTGTVSFELLAVSQDSCRLRLVHASGRDLEQIRSLGAGWHVLLDGLASRLGVSVPGGAGYADLLVVYGEAPVDHDPR